MNEVGFTIIVPCFNVMAYLPQCLNSILSQTYQNLEIILINDGSTDGTKNILDAYQAKDPRIIVVHKRNGGVSAARNDGLRLATKEYVFFLDADDFLTADIFVKANTIIQSHHNKLDILIGCSMKHYFSATNETKHIANIKADELKDLSNEEMVTLIVGNPSTLGIWAVWRHIYRRSLLLTKGIFFHETYAYAEDMDWLIQVLLVSEQFAGIDDPLCNYRFDNEQSATRQYKLRHVCNHIEILGKWITYFEQSDYEYHNKQLILQRLANKLMAIYSKINHLDKDDFAVVVQYLKRHSHHLKYVKGIKFKGAYLATQLVGIKRAARMLGKVNV